MRNTLLKHFTIIGSGVVINMLIAFITTPILTRLITPSTYGQMTMFNTFSSIALMVLCLGLDQSLIRFYYHSDNLEYKQNIIARCWILPIIIWAIIFVFSIFAKYKLNILKDYSAHNIILFMINLGVIILSRFSLIIIRVNYNSKLYALINILYKLIYLLSFLVFFFLINYTGFSNLDLLVYSNILSYLIPLVIGIISQRKYWRFNFKKVEGGSLISILKYGFPFLFVMGVTTIFQTSDRYFLNLFCTSAEVGIYTSAMNIINVFAVIQTTFNSTWMPYAIEHYEKNPEDRQLYIKVNQILTVILFFVGISLILFKDIIALLLGKDYRAAADIIPFLVFYPIMYTLSETTVCGMVFKKKGKYQLVSSIVACICNIIGNYLLVPRLGYIGSAISTAISYIVFFSLRTIISNKLYYIDFNLKKLYFYIFATITYAALDILLNNLILNTAIYIFLCVLLYAFYKTTIREMFTQLRKLNLNILPGDKVNNS